MSHSNKIPPHHLFHHEAMNTTFHLRICSDDESLAQSLACECFHKIDEIENKLSRYIEGSDVHRINHLKAEEMLYISEECHDCLLSAMEAYIHTEGLFDPTLGALIDHQKSKKKTTLPAPEGQLIIHPDTPAVTCQLPGRLIDLGGIGKGYALDKLQKLLTGWDIDGALLSSGASTHLAMGEHHWDIKITGQHSSRIISLKNETLSASGTTAQGSHIVHPETTQKKQLTRIWAVSDSATFADAWSTALMLMPSKERLTALSQENWLKNIYLEQDQKIKKVTGITP